MKTDITSKGKITLKSNLNDLKIGIKRFFLGHFYDSRKEVLKFISRTTYISHLDR